MPSMPDYCPCNTWTCVDTRSLACQVLGAHHPLCKRGAPVTDDELIDGLMARVNALETEANALRVRADAGYQLSTYAATIRWEVRRCPDCGGRGHETQGEQNSCWTCYGYGRITDRNTPEWLDGLRERIERVQELAKGKGVNADG